ncbi:ATP-binding protein [Lutispora sp.]|nr:ATP-binding protein [Lutispora sp.]MEA4962913.1 ATP-binding protein [Lutispora sp.]
MYSKPELIGRGEIIKRIYDRVNAQDSVSIVGYDGMGKSSLLNYMISDFDKSDTLMVEIFDSEPADTLVFYQTLFESLEREVEESNNIDINIKYELKEKFFKYENFQEVPILRKTLNDAFYRLRRNGIYTVLVIDDFDRMTKCINEGKKEDAIENFKYLRNLANNNRIKVRYIVTSKKSIEAISDECKVSGLPGIFNNPIKLELLEDIDIKKYILRCISQYQYRISSYEDMLIMRAGGRVPGILKPAVEIFLDYKHSKKELNKETEAEFMEKAAESCDYIFQSYWKSITYEEQRLLKHIACGEDISDIKESLLEVARSSSLDMKLLNEDYTFVSEAFMYYVKNAEVVQKDYPDMQTIIDNYKASNDIMRASFEELWKSYDDAKKVLVDSLSSDAKISSMEFDEREEYNEYISSFFKGQFEKYRIDLDQPELLQGLNVQKVWPKLDEDIRKQIVQAELLARVYRDTEFDQSPSCNPYCTAFEAIIKRTVLKPLFGAMQYLRPDFEIRKPGKPGKNEDDLQNRIMIGDFKGIMNDYFFYVQKNFPNSLQFDPIITVYNLKFKTKLDEIHRIRNKCMHWEDTSEGQRIKVEVADLDLLRKQMLDKDEKLGKDDMSCIEYLLKLAEACEQWVSKVVED